MPASAPPGSASTSISATHDVTLCTRKKVFGIQLGLIIRHVSHETSSKRPLLKRAGQQQSSPTAAHCKHVSLGVEPFHHLPAQDPAHPQLGLWRGPSATPGIPKHPSSQGPLVPKGKPLSETAHIRTAWCRTALLQFCSCVTGTFLGRMLRRRWPQSFVLLELGVAGTRVPLPRQQCTARQCTARSPERQDVDLVASCVGKNPPSKFPAKE